MSDAAFADADDDRCDEWIDDAETECSCPLCAAPMVSVDSTLDHLRLEHAFSLLSVAKSLKLDFYGGIRLVNYIRRQALADPKFDPATVVSSVSSWINDDAYLIPVVENDPLLYAVDFDEFDSDGVDDLAVKLDKSASFKENDDSERVRILERQLAELKSAFAEYKDHVRETFLKDFASDGNAESSRGEILEKLMVESTKDAWEMDYYFGSYAETEIHETMLKDSVRTESYRDCFYDNKDFFKDKIVLDVGCGTGILSMFAARAGAKQVYAVDNSTIILKAKEIVHKNGLSDKITFIRGEVEKISLPVKTVDVIVSEWMGYFLLFEGMFDSVITARDKWLAPNGVMAPSHAEIVIAGLEDSEWINDKLNFWNDVYGFDYTPMKSTFCADGQVDVVAPKCLISNPIILKSLDLATITARELDFQSKFSLKFTKSGRLHGLCGWFDIRFEFPHKNSKTVSFSTSPTSTPTHWKQTTFPLDEPVDVDEGTLFDGVFDCRKNPSNGRELDIVISYIHPNSKVAKKQRFTVR
ncbi:hypothetical protein HDU84_007723 [Entophlyctis sp. JEL0112]|nr:hypothetical protein HDU84_007723 [Entophlyctis sp. JEL0112]